MKSPSKNRKKNLDETSDASKILPLVKNELNAKAVTKSLNRKLKTTTTTTTTSKTDTHFLELSLNEPHNSSFAISPSSMSPSSSTYSSSSSSIIQNVTSKKRAVKDTRQFE